METRQLSLKFMDLVDRGGLVKTAKVAKVLGLSSSTVIDLAHKGVLALMTTVCHEQLRFESLFSKEVLADFTGGRLTSDAGGLLLRELDQRYRLTDKAAQCLHDPRDSHKVKHDLLTLVRQRLFSIALGYEDNNDAATLAQDPALKLMAGKLPEAGDLASQPTLSRFENRVSAKDLRRLSDWLLDLYLKTHPGPRKVIVLDMDATDDPTHGKQQLSFFHGYYEEHMYHPLLVFDGRTGFPLAAVLRPGNTHASHGALAVLKRLIKKLKKAYPGALILFRADAGFAVPALYRYLERQEIRYVIGFITNNRVLEKAAPLLEKARAAYQATGEKQRLFMAFSYQAESWTRPRRIIAKVEYTHLGVNQRFVVTNLHRNPQFVYEDGRFLFGEVDMAEQSLLLTPQELAAALKIPVSRVYQESRKRGPDAIPCVRLGKYVRFRLPHVLEWFERRGAR
jgi:hypothetical protein